MTNKSPEDFLAGKSAHTIALYHHFISQFETVGLIKAEATKSMIGISNTQHRIAWVTQFGSNFIHIVFPFRQPYPDNLCFTKIAQVPGTKQFNHHFRMLFATDVNEEVLSFMKLAYEAGANPSGDL